MQAQKLQSVFPNQLQIDIKEDLTEAFIYSYSKYSPPAKPSDIYDRRYITSYRLVRDSVPVCQCIDALVNYP